MFLNQLLLAILMLAFAGHSQAKPATLVYNLSTNQIVKQEGDNTPRPIASITKLMTAMVFLDSSIGLGQVFSLNRKVGTALPQKEYSALELLYALLVRSDNAAAETLAENYSGGRHMFIWAMNRKAQDLGLHQTRFIDPSGLGVFNISTLYDVSIMLKTANSYELIRSISTQQEIKLSTNKKPYWINLSNTNNSMLTQFKNIVVSKTGFTNLAGFCVVLVLNKQGHEFAVVVLGEKNKAQRQSTVSRIIQQLA